MKQNFKVFSIALIIGVITTLLVCYKFDPTLIGNAINSKVTYFSVGSYNDLTIAQNKKNNYHNALILNENGIYQVVIGVYNNKSTSDLMESYFLDQNIIFTKKEYKVDSYLLNNMKNYELLIASSNKDYYDTLNNSLLQLFNEYINNNL